jgi:hypothetical protein
MAMVFFFFAINCPQIDHVGYIVGFGLRSAQTAFFPFIVVFSMAPSINSCIHKLANNQLYWLCDKGYVVATPSDISNHVALFLPGCPSAHLAECDTKNGS